MTRQLIIHLRTHSCSKNVCVLSASRVLTIPKKLGSTTLSTNENDIIFSAITLHPAKFNQYIYLIFINSKCLRSSFNLRVRGSCFFLLSHIITSTKYSTWEYWLATMFQFWCMHIRHDLFDKINQGVLFCNGRFVTKKLIETVEYVVLSCVDLRSFLDFVTKSFWNKY